jgi:Fur family transcriptional regulator, ferric uptake regulator
MLTIRRCWRNIKMVMAVKVVNEVDNGQRFLKLLKQRGMKQTAQREEIVKQFVRMDGHVSAEELYDRLRETHPGIGFSTVYRTLNLLADCGMARRVSFGDGRTRFDTNVSDHHDHLVCEACGNTVEFSNSEVERIQDDVAAAHGFEIHHHRLELYGLCPDCRHRKQ